MPLWLISYWKPLFIGTCVILLSIGVFRQGMNYTQREWDADKAAQIIAIQEERDKLQTEANKKSSELEIALAAQREKNKLLNGRLAREIKINNTAYAACIVAPSSVQIYNDSISSGSSPR